ncbi:MAG TPA: hypothetical protein VK790_07235 [Solirubrobacteraceae bacterium]|nr:hypothetical protein [Solirubrobacteraceae bacterium]
MGSSQTPAPRSATTVTHAKQGAAPVLESPGALRAFARYVACMHVHGVARVSARTSPVRLPNARSATYRAANLACYATVAANQAVAGRTHARPPARQRLQVDL